MENSFHLLIIQPFNYKASFFIEGIWRHINKHCIETKITILFPLLYYIREKKYWKDFQLMETISVIVRELVFSNWGTSRRDAFLRLTLISINDRFWLTQGGESKTKQLFWHWITFSVVHSLLLSLCPSSASSNPGVSGDSGPGTWCRCQLALPCRWYSKPQTHLAEERPGPAAARIQADFTSRYDPRPSLSGSRFYLFIYLSFI